MIAFDRTNTSILNRWWWTVDRLSFTAFALLLIAGAVLVTAGSPPVANRIGVESFYFIKRHIAFMLIALGLIFSVSLMEVTSVRRFAVLGFFACLVMLMLVPLIAPEVKGARRWINLPGFSLQPSEFMKPFFAVVAAWLFSLKYTKGTNSGTAVSVGLYLLLLGLLALQPDIGMIITISAVWLTQLFLAGIPLYWVVTLVLLGVFGLFGAYSTFPHVAKRINAFLDPGAAENYQVEKSLEAFQSGGFFGQGPGEGVVKRHLPDSHTDFIFAVAGEEFGIIACLLLVTLFAFIVVRGFTRVYQEKDMFVLLAGAGLLTQFGVQAVINMGVALHLLPTKGMTLPFLSYGGSSTLAFGIGIGMLLALTRKRYGVVGG